MRLDLPRRRAARISLTPLIDVIFILLLFFMLTTRFDREQVLAIDLPRPAAAPATALDEITLRLSGDGALLGGNGQRIGPDDFATHSAMRQWVIDQTELAIDVDDEVTLQTLIDTLDRLDALGAGSTSVRGLGR